MHILIDQQEKAPWRFDCQTKVKHLETGDYSLPGFESVLIVERKNLSDLVKTVITDWQRFARQLRRMSAADVAYIVCEASVTALMEHKYSGDILPESVRGKLNAIQLDFGISTIFLDNREIAASWAHNLFNLFLQRRGMPSLTPLGKSKLPDLPFL